MPPPCTNKQYLSQTLRLCSINTHTYKQMQPETFTEWILWNKIHLISNPLLILPGCITLDKLLKLNELQLLNLPKNCNAIIRLRKIICIKFWHMDIIEGSLLPIFMVINLLQISNRIIFLGSKKGLILKTKNKLHVNLITKHKYNPKHFSSQEEGFFLTNQLLLVFCYHCQVTQGSIEDGADGLKASCT